MSTLEGMDEYRPPDCVAFTPYAEVRETHSAVVFLVGDRAYKAKRPVDLGFLDFSTPARRRAACERELVLNRRLTADVYLGISDLTGPDGGREPLLTMRRMPAERRLAHLIRTGIDVDAELRQLAAMMARFHDGAERSPLIARAGTREALLRRWTDNFAQIAPYVGGPVDPEQFRQIQSLVHRYLAGRADLLSERADGGAVLDGHGDLLAEDIFCLPDGIRVLDCIEFDDELRHLDRIDDIACLMMDLERLASPQVARTFLNAYRLESGDGAPASLVHHYIGYRAFMRAKVACLPGASEHGVQQTPALLELAHRHLDQGRVRLVLVGGTPGTGKTTTAEALGKSLEVQVLSSDRVRKELAGVEPSTPMRAEFGSGLYTRAWTDRTYGELVARAERLLGRGESVVIDATWAEVARREQIRALADRVTADLDCFRCLVRDEEADHRIGARHSFSDADQGVAARVRRQFADWPEATSLDCGRPVDVVVAEALERLQPRRATTWAPRSQMSPD